MGIMEIEWFSIFGLYGDNGKENGLVYRGYMRIMEKEMV